MNPYDPTPTEARRDLRRWAVGRREHAATLGPAPWQAIAAEKVLDELDSLEQANAGMVVTDLDAWGVDEAANLPAVGPGINGSGEAAAPSSILGE